MKRILITGAESYIGTSVEAWLKKKRFAGRYQVDTVDMRGEEWRAKDFSGYDTVFHVAGIAHADIGKVTEEEKKLYYRVNCDLALETARKAKAEGVGQFIYMSSIIVYGEGSAALKPRVITKETKPSPSDFYGDSKWKAEQRLRPLSGGTFCVAILRPPFVYGEGCRGNYQMLRRIALNTPIFPDFPNKRSMLYIGNLCEFVRLLIEEGKSGLFFPQNAEYVKTAELVRMIGAAHRRRVCLTKVINWAVYVGSICPGRIGRMIHKAFGSLIYEQKMSEYNGIDYRIGGLEETIKRTERKAGANSFNKKPLISIITVAFNSEKTIRKTIESVLNQTYTNIEYFIIDNQSSDDTVSIAQEYEERFTDRNMAYRIISERDKGIYDAMNKGIRLSSGELIGIINSNDWYEKNAVEKAVTIYRDSVFDVCMFSLFIWKGNRKWIKHSRERRYKTSRDFCHPGMFVKKQTYIEIGMYNNDLFYADFDFWLRVFKNGKKAIANEAVVANFTLGGISNEHDWNAMKRRMQDRFGIYRKNGFSRWYLFECALIELGKMLLT